MTMPPKPVVTAPVDAMAVGSTKAGLQAPATWHCEQSCGNGGEVEVPR
jgi:hypothetical protein